MDLVIRATVVFLFVYLVTRIVGRRELSTLEPFDLILLVVTGDLVQQGITQNDQSVTGAITVVATIGLLTVVVSWLSWRFRRLRLVLEGEPIVLVHDGEVVHRNVRRERLTVAEIEAEARIQQISSLDEVAWATLETDGRISFLPVSGRAGSNAGRGVASPASWSRWACWGSPPAPGRRSPAPPPRRPPSWSAGRAGVPGRAPRAAGQRRP